MAEAYFVTGATGAQGGHVARQLLRAGRAVHAIARSIDSPAAKALAEDGAKMFPGDFYNVESMQSAAAGCVGAFINVSPDFTDPEGESKQAAKVIEALRTAGVRKFVYSATLGTEAFLRDDVEVDPASFISGYLRSKNECEKMVREVDDMGWTIVKVPKTLNSFSAPLAGWMYPQLATEGKIKTALKPDLQQPVADPIDVGRVTTAVLLDKSGKHNKKTISLASDHLTMEQITALMNEAYGSSLISVEYYGDEELAAQLLENPMVQGEVWTNQVSAKVDADQIKELGIEMTPASQFFERERKAVRQVVGLA